MISIKGNTIWTQRAPPPTGAQILGLKENTCEATDTLKVAHDTAKQAVT